MAKKDRYYSDSDSVPQNLGIEDARARRKQAYELSRIDKKNEDSREEFRKFFAQNKLKLELSSSLEDVLWLHFKAYGFDKKESFSAGLKHFGIGE